MTVSGLGLAIQLPGQEVPPPAPGPGYIWSWDPALGKHVWKRCPVAPPVPRITGDWSVDVSAVRNWYDAVFAAERGAFQGWQECPAYGQIEPAKLAVDRAVKSAHPAARIPRLMATVWRLLLPGQHDIISGAALGYQTTVPGLVPGEWGSASLRPAPLRDSAAWAADRLMALDWAVSQIGEVLLRDDWPTYTEGLATWAEQGMTGAEIRARAAVLADLVRAWSAVPWPHAFFGTFLSAPMVEAPPFAGGFRYNDPMIATLGPRAVGGSPLPLLEKDIADYVSTNSGLLAQHFQAEFAAWVAAKEAELKREADKARRIELALAILGGILTLGAGLAVTISVVVAQVAVGIFNAQHLGQTQLEILREIYRVLGITESKLGLFREWLAAKAASMPPQAGPLGPPGSEGHPLSVFIEETFVGAGSDVEAMLATAWEKSARGDRIVVKDNASGNVVAVVVHTDSDEPLVVPAADVGAAMALPRGAAGSIGEPGVGAAAWLIPAVAVVAAVSAA